MQIRTRRLSAALVFVCVLHAVPLRAGPPVDAPASHETAEHKTRARVVLVGKAGNAQELQLVLSELLRRNGVVPDFERRDRFRASTLLSESGSDSRVWVFIIANDAHVAKLYFRGPFGERFLHRTLALKNGLDELGRELIAQVVETSTVALLRSNAGLSRDEVKADLSGQEEESSTEESGEPEPHVASQPAESDGGGKADARREPNRLGYELALRGVAKWTGSDLGLDHGLGAETALGWRSPSAMVIRGRLSFEYGFGQTVDAASVLVDLGTTALRAGAELEFPIGSSAFGIGIGGGADLVRVSSRVAPSASLRPAADGTGFIPIVRVEGRYRLSVGAFCVTGAVLADASLVDTHYDVQGAGGAFRVAEPWPVRPGVAVTLGWCPRL